MVFRIRFRRRTDGRESEAVVEASNPTEALVKFRHTCSLSHGMAEPAESITAVNDNGGSEPAL